VLAIFLAIWNQTARFWVDSSFWSFLGQIALHPLLVGF
jgi:hypothetical protein